MEKEIKHISGSAGGFLVGRSHANNGIKAINKSTGLPLEMEGGEVVITKTAVDDDELREFEGEMLTNRQILSKINESGGGVSFALGGDIPTELYFTGNSYKYGGDTLTDYEIAHKISSCGCKQKNDGLSQGKTIEDIAAMHNVSVSHIENQLQKGIQVEAEHSSDIQQQTRIAMDHLVENPNYYDILAEANLEKGGNLKKATENDDLDNVTQVSDEVLDGPDIIAPTLFENGGETNSIKQYKSYKEFIKDNIGKDEEILLSSNGYSSKVENGQTEESIDKAFDELIFHNFKDDNFSSNYASQDSKIEYKNLVQEYLDLLKNSPKEFENFWKNFITKSGRWRYLYDIKNPEYTKDGKRIELDMGHYVKNNGEKKYYVEDYFGNKTSHKAPIHYPNAVFLKLKDKISPTLLKEYEKYLEDYAGEKLSFEDEETEETLNSFPTDAEELKKSLFHVMQKLQGNKDLLSNIQVTYFENIVSENPKKQLKSYYEAIQVIPENKREYFQHEFSESKYNQLDLIEKLDDNPYNYLPEVLLPKTKVKKVDFSPNPDSVNLGKITELFTLRDELRPIMSGVYFNLEDERIEATNAHILLFIKEKPHVSKSCICLMGRTKEWYIKNFENKPSENQDGCWEIEGNYMRTSAVVPNEFEFIVTVDAQKLLDYAKASQYFIKYRPIRISFSTEDGIQSRLVNAAYLENSLKAMLMLGYEEVDFCMMLAKNRAIAIVPKGNSRKISYAGINTDLVLTMPFMSSDTTANDFVYDVDNNKATLFYKTKLVKTEPEVLNPIEAEIEVKELPKEANKQPIQELIVEAKEKIKEIQVTEEIKDTISGLEVLLPQLRGKDKTEAKDTIEALKLLLETDSFEKGGILTDAEKTELYQEWDDLVNMSSSELQNYYDSEEGKSSGLSAFEAKKLSIKSGRESARWIIKMKQTPVSEWTSEMWQWAKRQVRFIKRMKGVKGDLYDDKNQKTRKHKALLIWGHNPEKYAKGGVINKEYNLQFKPIEIPLN